MSIPIKLTIFDGTYESCELEICNQLIGESDRVVEIGSAIGFLSIYIRQKLGVSKYVCIEANASTAKMLEENYRLNDLEPHCVIAALNGADESVRFKVGRDYWADAICTDEDYDGNVVSVRGAKFSTLVREVPFLPTALIVDVEGAEVHLQLEDIPASIRTIIVETHPGVIGVPACYSLLNHFMRQGFNVRAVRGTVFGLARGTEANLST